MEQYHKLLKRQIKKYLPESRYIEDLEPFLKVVNEAYIQHDEDRLMIERSLELSSDELSEMIQKLREAQVELIQKEKMASIGVLAAGIAHEINNPLGFIISNINTLEKYVEKYLDMILITKELKEINGVDICDKYEALFDKLSNYEKQNNMEFIIADSEEIIEDSLEGLNRIAKIIEGLRDFSKVNVKECFSRYDLNHGIKSTLLIASNSYKDLANVELELGKIQTIQAMGSEINQVIINLLMNAVQAIKLKNKLGTIKISTYEEYNNVIFQIEDDGVGIPKENLLRIYDPFFTTKKIGEGTGLGLSISYDIIVNKHRGKIEVISEEGKGSTFTVRIPVNYDKGKNYERMCNAVE